MVAANPGAPGQTGLLRQAHSVRMIPVMALRMALSLFLVIAYLICVTTYFIPGLPISHAMLTIFLPGFELLNWQSFFLGLVESFAWGWFFALIFGPLFTSVRLTDGRPLGAPGITRVSGKNRVSTI